jgi:hypothetical protein
MVGSATAAPAALRNPRLLIPVFPVFIRHLL